MRLLPFLLLFALPAYAADEAVAVAPVGETACADGQDNDGDSLLDCADDDCAKAANCQPDGGAENSDARCSDWVDNDGNGSMDCDDVACMGPGLTACLGSFDRKAGVAAPAQAVGAPTASTAQVTQADMDRMGTGDDVDGERNDLMCSDGVDNDGDGAVDCADLGCRYSPEVTICRGSRGMRFSIVGALAQSYHNPIAGLRSILNPELENILGPDDGSEHFMDTRFTKLQLRSFGPIPLIQDSFYLVSMRAEKTPRLTFAMFQMPLGGGHYMNLNSGGGGLSNALILSSAKQLLLDAPYYLYSAFEQGNGAAVEVGGPIKLGRPGLLKYRVFAAGGSGRFAGNVGGRYFTYENTNYTYSVGAQVAANLIGFTSRWDSPFLLTPAATAVALRLGAKYDQRAQERYPAVNMGLSARSGRMIGGAEVYAKQEINYGSQQTAWNVQFGYLAIKKTLMIAADFGQFRATPFTVEPDQLETDLRKIRDQQQWRIAAHYYFWGNIGVASLVYNDHLQAEAASGAEAKHEQSIKLVAQYRF
jgi:hypothetical protein